MGKSVVMQKNWVQEGGNARPQGLTHIRSRLAASAMILRRGRALKPCAFGAPFGLRGLTAPPRRKAGSDAVNGSPCFSLTGCCAVDRVVSPIILNCRTASAVTRRPNDPCPSLGLDATRRAGC